MPSLLLAILGAAGAARAQETPATEDITVLGATPVLGSGIDLDKTPNVTRVLHSQDLARDGTPSLTGTLDERIGSVNLNETLENPYQPDLLFRGFEASPLEGTPQGIAVYQNGVRLNEPFGDTMNWDLIPDIAIDSLNLTSTNPVFGFNALGGAAALEMKNGFSYDGAELDLSGGSFGRRTAEAQMGKSVGNWGVYVAGTGSDDGGWRQDSPSRQRQVFADLGWQNDDAELHLSFTGANNHLGGVGPVPVQLLAAQPDAVLTYPDTIHNELAMVSSYGAVKLGETLSIEGNWYYRSFRQDLVNGNPSNAQACDASSDPALDPNSFCSVDGLTGRQYELLDQHGHIVPLSVGGTTPAEDDMAQTVTTGLGGSLQMTEKAPLFDHGNHLVVGSSLDHGNTSFMTSTRFGTFNADRAVVSDGLFVTAAGGPLRPVSLETTNTYLGLYATDTFDLQQDLSLTASGRYNLALVHLIDRNGGDLSGNHRYDRFNPAIGLTYKFTGWLTGFVDYAENSRVPTAAELSCADPTESCTLAAFFVADPPLQQIVARTEEAGLRGGTDLGDKTRLEWNFNLFHTDNSNDIIEVASAIPGRGFFQNAGDTQRQGLEASLTYRDEAWHVFLDYSLVDARFESPLALESPNNPFANAAGEILVRPGDRLPGIPEHRLKLGADYGVTDAWTLGATLTVASDQVLRGDESNQTPPLPGYATVKLHSEYRLNEHLQLFADIDNLFDANYATFGTFTDVTQVPIAQVPNISNPRTVSPGAPVAGFAGVRITF